MWTVYEPPYESPIEGLFAYSLDKYLVEDAYVDSQVEVPTRAGTFRLDFLCTAGCRRIAFECDGREYHDAARDQWRDALIMATRRVNAIFRLPGHSVFHQIDRSLYLVSLDEPSIFSERGRVNLATLGEADMVSVHRYADASFLKYNWYPERLAHLLDDQDLASEASRETHLRILKSTDKRFNGQESEWVRKARFAQRHPDKAIDQLMKLYPY